MKYKMEHQVCQNRL